MSLSNTMKALEKSRPEEGLRMVQVPVPEIGPEEVLIRINKTGICGTDIHIWNWDDWAAATVPVPLTIGHEFAGEIVEVGRDVTGLKVGQRCSGEGHMVGSDSRQSRSGKFHLDPGTRGIGVNVPGAFAEYLKLPAFNVVPLPGDIPDEIGAILDPLGNAVHAALSFDVLGEDVLITGAGPIGIMAATVVRHAGARHVVITDINPARLELVEHVVPSVRTVDVTREDLHDVISELEMREGFDVGLEMSGSQAALDQMVEALVMGGKIALLGIPPGTSPVNWARIVFKAITIKGIYGREMFETWYKMIAMLQHGLDVSRVITHRFDVNDFENAFAAMRSGQSGKVVLNWR